jgi:hypothetical protein
MGEVSKNQRAVLDDSSWNFWKENGYVVIKKIVPKEQVERTVLFIWEFEDKDPNDIRK